MAGEHSNGYAADTIANEGLEYAVRHYIDGDSFADPKTAQLWAAAADALNALVEYLNEQTGRDIDDE